MLEIVVFSLIILVFGVLPSIWYLKRKDKVDENQNPNIIIVILASLLIVANTYFAYIVGQGSIAYVIVYVYVLPIVLVLIFSRNWKSRWNTVFYTSLLIFLSILGNLATAASEVVKQVQT